MFLILAENRIHVSGANSNKDRFFVVIVVVTAAAAAVAP